MFTHIPLNEGAAVIAEPRCEVARRAHVCFLAPTTWPVLSADRSIKVIPVHYLAEADRDN
jgi:hypothetical protein